MKEFQELKITQAEHRARAEISASDIKKILDNPFLYANPHLDELSDKTLATFSRGNLFHTAVLEPKQLENRYLMLPSCDLRTKAGKELKAEFELKAQTENKELVSEKDFTDAKNASAQLREFLGNRLENINEHTFIGEVLGKKAKVRPDSLVLADGTAYIIDLKTTQKADSTFERSIANYRYYLQAYFYCELFGVPLDNFMFIAIETNSPYMFGYFKLSETYKELAEKDIKRAYSILDNLEEYKHLSMYASFDVAGNPTKINIAEPPAYLFYQK